ncbi:hypothetical protein TSUD_327440 [Trifolium subterraneum]|uniref:eRF1/Pelota-like N-terminal domain-containing protein n=1 Tax=Trifolium subterraneum TaxID=3900 RepID=A0A2Z6NER5_TRISU|nr:hypothetical protein TSUD_327440 [Trifolium subterraneum]
MLGDEFGTASNIKSRVNRQSVLGAITYAQQKLKLYNKVPPNGLVIYTGTVVTDEGKEKKKTYDFEPFKPINASLYLCDNKFHMEGLNELLGSDDKYGFIVMDGNGTLFGTLSGNTREDGKTGTITLGRLQNLLLGITSILLLVNLMFLDGLVLAGSADFKTELSQSDMFDPRLQTKILKVVDVSYGKYFEEIRQETGIYVYGVDDTLKALEIGAVETLIVWGYLDINRYVLKNATTGEIVIKHLKKEQEADQSNFRDPATNADLEVQEKMPLLEWFANEYKKIGCSLELKGQYFVEALVVLEVCFATSLISDDDGVS